MEFIEKFVQETRISNVFAGGISKEMFCIFDDVSEFCRNFLVFNPVFTTKIFCCLFEEVFLLIQEIVTTTRPPRR